MLRIGEAAKTFGLSRRTLRHWEDEGILKSMRGENGYRHYDQFNIRRIRQIVALRRLNMPIADIERMFAASDTAQALGYLQDHLLQLKQGAAGLQALAACTEEIILRLHQQSDLDQALALLERAMPAHAAAASNTLLERNMPMTTPQLDNVRIVRLPAMHVASYRAISATPEEDCSRVFNAFVLEHALHKRDGYRFFGFNNPSPTAADPVYGYEMWVTVPADFDVPAPLQKKHVCGGLYASISTQMNEIGERWQRLAQWCRQSERYEVDADAQWLEECSMDFEFFASPSVPGSEKQLDLLEPIKERQN